MIPQIYMGVVVLFFLAISFGLCIVTCRQSPVFQGSTALVTALALIMCCFDLINVQSANCASVSCRRILFHLLVQNLRASCGWKVLPDFEA
ncbi:uncharacterized protein GGS25DRAFT_490960 [Hypoxylon fragiforme]|uniref:uncharacterized protein n=1 Tax=Hypoxylon fragiforme TaxID=63214 RepID=UPI0020C6708A|nr:uncharacterized protein GGS25DRAFT_490960 [Hypoxylon fragiforme]KAI2608604.1 hypothetical protein GGS25DRAFT_490960 [Hypoxylon fragiforme]